MDFNRCLLSFSSSPDGESSPAAEEDAAKSVTRLLAEAERSEGDAWNRIYDLIYQDLHRIARSQIRQQLQPNLSPTSLISEAWLKLMHSRASVSSHRHLLSLNARAMRFVLIDEARRILTSKRGGYQVVKPLSSIGELAADDDHLEEVLELDKALESLAKISPRLARVVELRYYGGLEETEVAELLGMAERTIRRDWRKARAFLQKQLMETEQTAVAAN